MLKVTQCLRLQREIYETHTQEHSGKFSNSLQGKALQAKSNSTI